MLRFSKEYLNTTGCVGCTAEATNMENTAQREIRQKMKKYLGVMVGINPATASGFWREVSDTKLVNLPSEIDDLSWWGSLALGWEISEMADEAALNEVPRSGTLTERRAVQRAFCNALLTVYRGFLLVPSGNPRKALPIEIGKELMSLAIDSESSVECAMEVLRTLLLLCRCPDLKDALEAAQKECEISRAKDHLTYILNPTVLWTTSLGYGVFLGCNTPSDASEHYRDELPSMRAFQIQSMEGGDV